jgi:hypothetical protein
MAKKIYNFDDLTPEAQHNVLFNESDWVMDAPSFYNDKLQKLCQECESLSYLEAHDYMLKHGLEELKAQARRSQFYADGELFCE